MDVIFDKFTELSSLSEYYMSRGDDRVSDWFLMQSFWPTLALTAAYLTIVYYGQRAMLHRTAFEFPTIMFLYNAFLVALNFHIFYELLSATLKLNYSYTCQPVHYGDDPDEMRIAKALWWYYFSKLIEFMDTIFFVFRKKQSQITFLHVYHHATMFPIWWTAFFGAMINSLIHVFMYTYYGVSSLGPAFQKYLWWKRYMTRLQLLQFIAAIVHTSRSLYYTCNYPKWMQWSLTAYAMSIMALFINFYFQSYIKKSQKQKKESVDNGLYDAITRTNSKTNGKANGHSNTKGNVICNGKTNTHGNAHGNGRANGYSNGLKNYSNNNYKFNGNSQIGSGDSENKKQK